MVVMTMGTATTMFAQLILPTSHHQLLCLPLQVRTATATTKTNPDVDAAPTSNDDRESTTMEIVLFDSMLATVVTATAKMAVMTTVKIAVTKLAAQQR